MKEVYYALKENLYFKFICIHKRPSFFKNAVEAAYQNARMMQPQKTTYTKEQFLRRYIVVKIIIESVENL